MNSKRAFFISMILVAIGISMNTTMDGLGSLGTVLIAVGGLFLIIAFDRRNKERTLEDQDKSH